MMGQVAASGPGILATQSAAVPGVLLPGPIVVGDFLATTWAFWAGPALTFGASNC